MKAWTKKKYKIILGTMGIMVILVLLPLLLDFFIFSNNYASNVTNDGWAGFLGGYIGGIIGGVVTLIAMIVPLRQTQKQIMEAKEKDELVEKRRFANEITSLVVQYISDLQVYYDKKTFLMQARDKKLKDWIYYHDLHSAWKQCQKNRWSNGLQTYYEELSKNNISIDYVERFFMQYDMNDQRNACAKYEEELGTKIRELDGEIEKIDEKINNIKQKCIVGNNTYLLLEFKLKNISCGKELWRAITDIQEQEKYRVIPWKCSDKGAELSEKIEAIKMELRNFVNCIEEAGR